MSEVIKGVDLTTGEFVAIKTWLSDVDPKTGRESLHREAAALSKLQHKNIIKLLDFVRSDSGRDYLVLEWLGTSLYDYIQTNGSMSWGDYHSKVGRFIADAVAYAHRQGWTHRDISSRNILLAEDGSPRLIDYGISKLTGDEDDWAPVAGKTFRENRTHGYSPPEIPVGLEAYRRDCFSLGAVICYALSAVDIVHDEDLRVAFENAELPEEVRPIVDRAISLNPDSRFPMAGLLLERLNEAEGKRWAKNRTKHTVFVSMIESVRFRLRRLVADDGKDDVGSFLKRELNEDPLCLLPESEFDSESPDVISEVHIYAPEWRFTCRVSGKNRDHLDIVDAFKIGQAAAQRDRDFGDSISVSFSLTKPSQFKNASREIGEFLSDLWTDSRERRAKENEQREQKLYGAWRALVREQAALDVAKEGAISYVGYISDGDRATFDCEELLTSDFVEQRRFVKGDRGRVFGKVIAVSDSSLVLDLLGGNPEYIPKQGILEVDTKAAERAVSTQIMAIDKVQYGDCANPSLPSLLVVPGTVTPPKRATLDWASGTIGPIDDKLKTVVEKGVGNEDLYVIEGPPGTGKTSLIANLIVRYLEVHPAATILLTSQTHIAVDNVVEKLVGPIVKDSIIRIGQQADQRIPASSQELLLGHRVDSWAKAVQRKANENLGGWAAKNGIDVQAVEAGIWVERILQCLYQISDLKANFEKIESESDDDKQDEATVSPGSFDQEEQEVDIDVALTELRSAIKQVERAEQDARIELRALGDDAAQLASSSDVRELEDWLEIFFSGGEKIDDCRKRIGLLEGWFRRLGRGQDFHVAMIDEASVIASTCVAIGRVRGVDQVPFDLCIVDEASKATAPEALIPMTLSKKWILVGDPKQLPPFFDRSARSDVVEEIEEEAKRTILDRCLDANIGLGPENRERLETQHRMIRPIGDLVSKVFYEGWLKSAHESHGRNITPLFPTPVAWFTTSSRDHRFERRYGAHSYQNRLEVEAIRSVLDRLQIVAKNLHIQLKVAVISGYVGQVKLLEDMCNQHASDFGKLSIESNSVDAFQGREADVCIYSVTRSNPARDLGFLREKPRLNVALSRGRTGLIIVGDHRFCRSARGENPFADVIEYIEINGDDCTVVKEW